MNRISYLFILFIFSLNACATVSEVRLRVTVSNEAGVPVEGAYVKGFFFQDQVVDKAFKSSHVGMTDEKGFVDLVGREEIYVDINVTKDGYYNSALRVNVRNIQTDQVNILLREKINPVAMYAKKAVLSARDNRKQGEQFGYDLMVGDFVAPYGAGSVSDLLITHTYDRQDVWNYSYSFKIDFSNPEDGIVPFYFDYANSDYKSAYAAPETGYLGHWEIAGARQGAGEGEVGTKDPRRNYYFRVRTRKDDDGNIVSAFYGKIYGEFPSISYYLNPTANDRNIEFDIARNLFRGLDIDHRVSTP